MGEQSSLALVELANTEFGELDGEPSPHIWSKFGSYPRGINQLHALVENAGFKVKTFPPHLTHSGNLFKYGLDEIVEYNILGISAISSTITASQKLALEVKKRKPNEIVVVGGPHSTNKIEETLKWADFVVRGEGDITLIELLKQLGKDGTGRGVLGVSYMENGKIKNEDERQPLTIEEYSNLPFPHYDESLLESMTVMPYGSTRGCNFKCNYCVVKDLYGTEVRRKIIDAIIRDLKIINGMPQKQIMFIDDNFAPDRAIKYRDTKGLLREIIRQGLNNKIITAQVRAEVADDEEFLKLYKKAGGFAVYVGFESTNDKSLKDINKGQSFKKIKRAAEKFRKYGIHVHGMFIIGLDFDDKGSINHTINFAQKYTDSSQIFLPLCLPGSDFTKEMEKDGRILTKDYSLYDAQHVTTNPLHISPYDLQMRAFEAYHQIYSKKNQGFRILSDFSNLGIHNFNLRKGLIKFKVYPYARDVLYAAENSKQTKEHIEFLKDFSKNKVYR